VLTEEDDSGGNSQCLASLASAVGRFSVQEGRSDSTQNYKFKKEALTFSTYIEILHQAIFEYSDQLYQLGRLQILNRIHDINFGT
jgi:hypothetical protein